MRLWRGRFKTGDGALAFPGPTLLRHGRPVSTQCKWWPIRSVFGLQGKRFALALILLDEPKHVHIDPKDLPA